MFLRVAKIYIFGETYGIPGLKNEAIDKLHEVIVSDWRYPTDILNYVYEHTKSADTAMRSYLVGLRVGSFSHDTFRLVDQDKLPRRFLLEVLVGLQKKKRASESAMIIVVRREPNVFQMVAK
jgi:hypothetical protein